MLFKGDVNKVLDRIEEVRKVEGERFATEVRQVKARIDKLEDAYEDFPEIRHLTRTISESLASQTEAQREAQKIQLEFSKTQIAQTETLKKISEVLQSQGTEIRQLHNKIEEHKEKDVVNTEKRIDQMKQDILNKTFEDKKEIKGLIEGIMVELKSLKGDVERQDQKSKIDMVKVLVDNAKVLIGGAIAWALMR